MSETKTIYRVVDKNGTPVEKRNNRRKNRYATSAHAQSAATQFNDILIFKHGETQHIDGYPFSVREGVVSWES